MRRLRKLRPHPQDFDESPDRHHGGTRHGGGGDGCSLPPPPTTPVVLSSSSSSSMSALSSSSTASPSALSSLFLSLRCASWFLCVASVAPLSCAALSSSRRAGWLLRVASHLLTHPVAPPSRPLVVPAVCCVPQASVALSGCTALLSSRRAG